MFGFWKFFIVYFLFLIFFGGFIFCDIRFMVSIVLGLYFYNFEFRKESKLFFINF